jgi:hypothetical protein
MLTSSAPQPSSTVDIVPYNTWDPLVASPLRHTKPTAHALTQKTYIANRNGTCPKPAQEDITDDFVSSTPRLYRDDLATLPTFHYLIDQTNSSLS